VLLLSVSEKTVRALKDLGLTEYETASYLALVEKGQMSASEISAKSRVPYSRIYDVLSRLEEKGFIQVRRGRPTLYVAKAPTEVVRLVRLAWEDKIDKSSKTVVGELQPRFEREVHVTTRDVWVMHGKASILAKAIEMLNSAREEVKLSLPSLDLELDDIASLADRVLQVKAQRIYVLTSSVADSLRNLIPRNFEIRIRNVFGAGLVVDGRETLIMLTGASGELDSEFLGVYSSHAVMAGMAGAYFDSLYASSKPFKIG
jgi:sugar-specific transcriptional regulator TrmB